MKAKILLLIIAGFISANVKSQSIELSGGGNWSRFYDLTAFDSEYNAGLGGSIRLGFAAYIFDSIPLSGYVSYYKYQGEYYTEQIVGHGSGHSSGALFNNKAISVGLYLLDLKSKNKRFNCRIGADMSFLIDESNSGERIQFSYADDSKVIPISNDKIHNKTNLGLVVSCRYMIPLKNNWYFVPQNIFYFGVINELKYAEANAKSMKDFFEVGIVKAF